MERCNYCGRVYPDHPADGACLGCGAVSFTALAPRTESVVKTTYIYVPAKGYYHPGVLNPVGAVRAQVVGAFGYKIGTAVFLALMAFVIWQVYVAFIKPGIAKINPGVSVPTAQATRPFEEPVQKFAETKFFSAQESESLRNQTNVVNIAVLGDGYGARYMADYAVVLDEDWKEVQQVFGIAGFTPGESSFTIQVDNVTYNLNKYQGFVLANRPNKIYLVDKENRIWESDFSESMLVPVTDAQSNLPAPIPANPQLTLTLK